MSTDLLRAPLPGDPPDLILPGGKPTRPADNSPPGGTLAAMGIRCDGCGIMVATLVDEGMAFPQFIAGPVLDAMKAFSQHERGCYKSRQARKATARTEPRKPRRPRTTPTVPIRDEGAPSE